MAEIRHAASGFIIGDPERPPIANAEALPTEEDLDSALSRLILSASGWRTIFDPDGEEGKNPSISAAHTIIAATAASVFARYLKEWSGLESPTVLVGMDTRPTGPMIADAMIRAFIAEGLKVRHAFIVAAPEIMALARRGGELPEDHDERIDGFAYISASHNPIGHNGLKFGLTDGGVLPAEGATMLIEAFKKRMDEVDRIRSAFDLIGGKVDQSKILSSIYSEAALWKRRAISAYTLFAREVVTGFKESVAQDSLFNRLQAGLAEHPLSILIDLNGSARTMSIDQDFLAGLGIGTKILNGSPRAIAHRIVPEGESLEPARRALEEAHAEDPSYLLGYVPDCDGDRGNLVIWDDDAGKARALEAQEVFALSCVAELSHLVWTGELHYDQKGNALDKVAVAINDPTSMRIDRIAAAFDVDVFRAEVGEANVVNLARKVRERGYKVRILGEGAAGGTITHPSAVRDPLATVFALIKLLAIRSEANKPGFFELWCGLADKMESYKEEFGVADIVATLPAFKTTSAYEEEAMLRIRSSDPVALKNRYQNLFLDAWGSKREELSNRFAIASWEALAYNGTEEKRGIKSFGEAGKGGLKILFRDATGHPRAFIWMRGSGTEPVLRVMADAVGKDPRMERDLLEWQRKLVQEADSQV